MDEPKTIVLELATSLAPIVATSIVDTYWCVLCQRDALRRSDITGSFDHMNDPANHEPACLWRRAKALYPTLQT